MGELHYKNILNKQVANQRLSCMLRVSKEHLSSLVTYFNHSPSSGSIHVASSSKSDGGNSRESTTSGSEEEAKTPHSSLRRKTVFARSYDPETDRSLTEVHKKGADEIKRITEAMKTIPLLSHLEEEIVQQICMAMENREVNAGDVIIKEGEEGDYFYIVESGTYEATQTVNGKTVVCNTYKNKGSFGELALLYNQPRGATVVAKTKGKLWALSQKNFKKTVAAADMKKRTKISLLVSKVDILNNLKEDEKMKLSDALESKTYQKGTLIFAQGDVADGMYFIEQGQVTIYVGANAAAGKVKTLKANEYFGELALLTHQPRAASAVAETDVTLAFLNVDAFERLLGSCDSIMRRNAKTYDKQLKKLFAASVVPTLRK